MEGKSVKKPTAESAKPGTDGKDVQQTSNNDADHHALGQKTIADVCEALIGAAFLTHDVRGEWTPGSWRDAIRAVTYLVGSEDHRFTEWSQYSQSYVKPAYQIAVPNASQLDLAAQVAKAYPYKFRHPRLLRSAFVHPSQPFAWEGIPSYQRLEFLGDSLLDLACVTHLYYHFPDKDPQWLTEHKMAMVANKFLGVVCVELGFHRHLRHNSSAIQHQISEYVAELAEAERMSNGAKDYWTEVKDPPKCLADIVEAFVGALFIDSDFDYSQVQKFFDLQMKPFFVDMDIYDSFANNHPIVSVAQAVSS